MATSKSTGVGKGGYKRTERHVAQLRRAALIGAAKNYKSPEQRFWAKVDKSGGPDACWLWTGAQKRFGYGNFGVSADRQTPSHRFSYELAHGVITESGLFVCHRCDNPPCVNPAHLFLGTPNDNYQDMKAKGRSARGERHGNTTLTPEQVIEIRALGGNELKRVTAARYGISINAVSQIQRGTRWTHLDGAPNAKQVRRRLSVGVIEAIRGDKRLLRIVAKEYGISIAQVSRIRNGIAWREVDK